MEFLAVSCRCRKQTDLECWDADFLAHRILFYLGLTGYEYVTINTGGINTNVYKLFTSVLLSVEMNEMVSLFTGILKKTCQEKMR